MLENSVPVRDDAIVTEPLRDTVDACGDDCLPGVDDDEDDDEVDDRCVDLADLRSEWCNVTTSGWFSAH